MPDVASFQRLHFGLIYLCFAFSHQGHLCLEWSGIHLMSNLWDSAAHNRKARWIMAGFEEGGILLNILQTHSRTHRSAAMFGKDLTVLQRNDICCEI